MTNDPFLAAAVDALGDDAQAAAAMADLRTFLRHVEAMRMEMVFRQVRTAPRYRLALATQVGIEAARREQTGDPTAPAWRAWVPVADAIGGYHEA